MKKFISFISLSILLLPVCAFCEPKDDEKILQSIKLPAGFSIFLYAKNVKGARSLAVGDKGTVFVASRGEGKVYALVDEDRDNFAERVLVISEGLNSPNGVALYNGSLFVAEISRVIRFDNIEDNLEKPLQRTIVNDTFPRDTHHGWKFIGFGPDGYLYVPVGAPCNVCEEADPRYASIMRMKPDGSDLHIFSRGIRNTVGFDWHPETHELWFTDNGRDWMGDNVPPDELNRAPGKGLHFGFPYYHGKGIPDNKFKSLKKPEEFVPAAIELGPHVASLGMRFYTGNMFPQEYKNQIFIAEHGSWNRSKPIGYRITLVKLKDNTPVSYETFAYGWLQGRSVLGRPVDLLVMPDGSLLVSDDKAGLVYRIIYVK